MSRVVVVLLMGLPGSGKTTLCQRLLQLDGDAFQLKHICYDELLEVNDSEKWRDNRDGIIRMIEDVIVNYNESGTGKKLMLLIDDNFYYQSMRRMYYKMARRHKVPTCILFLQCTEELATARVEKRAATGGLKVDKKIISQMAQKIELPVEHNWEKFSLKINPENFEVNSVWKSLLSVVEAASKNQVFSELKSEESPENSTSIPNNKMQEAEVALRKFISSEMQAAQSRGLSKIEMAALAQQLNLSRKQFLKQYSDTSSMTDIVDQFRQFIGKTV